MLVTLPNGWSYDVAANTLRETPDSPWLPAPLKTTHALIHFGLNYLYSPAAIRDVHAAFRAEWLEKERETNPKAKAADFPKALVPAPETEAYQTALAVAHKGIFAKMLEGYEVGARKVAALDPLEVEAWKIGRAWLQQLTSTRFQLKDGRFWYTLPPKQKVAKDEDPYDGPNYSTFGDALAAFMVSTATAAGKLVSKTKDGKPWPFKIKAGATVSEAIYVEAARRIAEREAKLAGDEPVEAGDVEF